MMTVWILRRQPEMDKSYIVENSAELERLKTLVARLSDDELSHPMPAGWTVAGVLAHLAFWDARALYFINQWESGTAPSEADLLPDNMHWVNDSAKPLCLALPPRTAAQLAVQVAGKRIAGSPLCPKTCWCRSLPSVNPSTCHGHPIAASTSTRSRAICSPAGVPGSVLRREQKAASPFWVTLPFMSHGSCTRAGR